jgi:hypothetical protein
MKTTAAILAGAAALSGLASAQYSQQSAPFDMVVLSTSNSTLNGSYVFPCHTGAAIETLCILKETPNNYDSYYFNTSSASGQNNTLGAQGILSWLLPFNTNQTGMMPFIFSLLDSARPFKISCYIHSPRHIIIRLPQRAFPTNHRRQYLILS